jgi:hypothetical protein
MPPQAVTGPTSGFVVLRCRLVCFLLLAKEAANGNRAAHARDRSKRLGVNKTNSKTAMLHRRPSTKSGQIFLVENQCSQEMRNLPQSAFKET